MTSPKTPASLIARLRDPRDHLAWTEFTAIYEPLLIRLMQKQGLQEADARDACQQVLHVVARDVERWRPDGKDASFRRWLFRVARNRALQVLDKQRRKPPAAGGTDARMALEALIDFRATPAAFDSDYRQQLLLWAAERIKSEFRPSTWEAFWQTCVAGRPVADVAAELGTTPGNIYVARSRVIARLREQVKTIDDD